MHLDSASFSLNRLESLDPPSSGLCARSSSNTVSGKMAENPNPSKIGRRQKVQFVWCFYNRLPVSQIEELTLFHQSSVKEAEQGEGAVLEALVFGHAVSGGLALIFLHDRGVLDLGLVLLLVHAVVEVASDLVVCPVGEGALDLLEVSVVLVNEGLEEGFFFSCPASGLSSCHFDIMSGVNSFITMWVIQHRVTYLLFTFKFDLDQISHRKTA
ncbi:Hypothetical_protein [Hexamita inflata]|uniref:Hypothetical_protein n=1 Tax=Hexamita inflata TaxID=28002 RepID=A0AA86QBE7_9EUKA|nr:Hypothetical protein HINF_LOCUS40617 [Hexamita inflata]CAI9952974.1 Hypothetical protein HINF_LOCUS40619 [Hexamita inflata]CAI9956589.1 Hypothetical protein HINF_LOCUS44234 [Hexamita inflata]CAI9966587.1 Hypothetical protein HINF_LOCUS54232 [Hexamita inflata]